MTGAQLGEETEGRLVSVTGVMTASPTKSTSGDITFFLVGADGASVRVMADASSGLATADLSRGARYRAIGIAGQRATRRGSLDGYRVWMRDPADLARLDSGSGSPTAGPSPSAGSSGERRAATGAGAATGGGLAAVVPGAISIARALVHGDGVVRVAGVVTAGPDLLDSGGRRIVVEDASAAVEVLLPADASRVVVGDRLDVTGTMTRAYGAPRLRATAAVATGRGAIDGLRIRVAPGPAHEWRLVSISGPIDSVHRLGTRWTAEVRVGSERLLVIGLPGSGIPATAVEAGRVATITGIVRRPYPTAVDRRFAVVPRSSSDVALGPRSAGAVSGGSAAGRDPGSGRSAAGTPTDGSAPSGHPDGGRAATLADVDLGQLDDHLGEDVRVGGIVITVDGDAVVLDDGTAEGRIRLTGEAAAYLPLIVEDDALNATGRVVSRDGGAEVEVADPTGLVRVGDLGESVPIDALPVAAEGRASGSPTVVSPGTVLARGEGPAADGALVGLAILAPASLGAAVVAASRRRRARAGLRARVAGRLAALTAVGEGGAGWRRTQAARSDRLDARERPGLSSPEFRASEGTQE